MGRHKEVSLRISEDGSYVDVVDVRGEVLARFDGDGEAFNWCEDNGYKVRRTYCE